jgi:hypothetical protein
MEWARNALERGHAVVALLPDIVPTLRGWSPLALVCDDQRQRSRNVVLAEHHLTGDDHRPDARLAAGGIDPVPVLEAADHPHTLARAHGGVHDLSHPPQAVTRCHLVALPLPVS